MAATHRQKEAILDELGDLVLECLPQPGILKAPTSSFQFVRHDEVIHTHNCLAKPIASLIVQGDKKFVMGTEEFGIKKGDCIVVAVDMPSSSMLENISSESPFLCVSFDLNRNILADLLLHVPCGHTDGYELQGVSVLDVDTQFADAILRLAMLMKKPFQIPVLAPLILRELHYLLLISPQGGSLRDIYIQGAKNNQIIEVIAWLKHNLNRAIRIEDIARHAHMSISSLHRHFKSLTGISPLQYHKQLRLHEAQRLMLTENERAASAALSVGYESVTQFNREYKRMFGEPPHRDINRRRGGQIG